MQQFKSWWRHQMETFCAFLALCAGNSPVTGKFPSQRPVTQSFDVFVWSLPWINGWVNNGEAGDLRHHRAYYDVIVMCWYISGAVVETEGGTGEDDPCIFPLVYNGNNYYQCITANHDRPWCGTTAQYEQDDLWGNCLSKRSLNYMFILNYVALLGQAECRYKGKYDLTVLMAELLRYIHVKIHID